MASKELKIGDKAPLFDMPTDGGGSVSLSSLAGRHVVLYFYPKDDTSGCTKEACDFRDNVPNFGRIDAAVIGVSRDSVASHDKFKKKYTLPFALASDGGGKTSDCLRHLGREEHVRAQVHGHGARDLPDRRQGRDPRHLA